MNKELLERHLEKLQLQNVWENDYIKRIVVDAQIELLQVLITSIQ